MAAARSAPARGLDRPRRVLLVALVGRSRRSRSRPPTSRSRAPTASFVRESLELQADSRELRYQANPRLRKVAAGIPRGDILDRDGIVLATSDWSHLERQRARLEALGVDLAAACDRRDDRHYPFGGITYHLLGDLVSQRDWGSPNSAFVERRYETTLRATTTMRVVTIRDPRSGENRRIVSRDLSELIPLWRHRYEPGNRQVKALLARPRDLTLTVDVRPRPRASRAAEAAARGRGVESGAVVVLDPADRRAARLGERTVAERGLRGERRPGAADVDGVA
mgnify:CR=1 FL=1